MPTQTQTSPKGEPLTQAGAPRPTPNGTARRPAPPKPVVFQDFASI